MVSWLRSPKADEAFGDATMLAGPTRDLIQKTQAFRGSSVEGAEQPGLRRDIESFERAQFAATNRGPSILARLRALCAPKK